MRTEEQKKQRKIENKILADQYKEYWLANQNKESECKLCSKKERLSEFVQNWSFREVCRKCHSASVKRWRNGNREAASRISRKGFEKSADYIKRLKEGKPCFSCGGFFHPCALDFHHMDAGTKLTSLSKLYGKKQRRIDEEVEKCVLLCANCHRNETMSEESSVPVSKNRVYATEIVEKELSGTDKPKGCAKCLTGKHEENFTLLKTGKRHSYCRKCLRDVNRGYGQERGELTQRKAVRDLKDDQPCSDCGFKFRYWQMDFDHVRGKKIGNLNRLSNGRTDVAIQETKKCDLVCANCHRLRTFLRKEHLGFKETCRRRTKEAFSLRGVICRLQHRVRDHVYDVHIEGTKVLLDFVEFGRENSKSDAMEKKTMSAAVGLEYIMAFEDEWKEREAVVLALLMNKVGATEKPENVRPARCEIKRISLVEADAFYDRNHYIGKCKSAHGYGAFFKGELVAAASFKNPTRQSSHPWELVRMVSHPKFRVHGIWSKLLKRFIDDYSPSSIVSFSDDRLFSGRVYEKIGFKLDGTVVQDYYWTKDGRRFHKSGLRKRGSELTSGITERELREKDGYRRVWDLGKTRWTWTGEKEQDGRLSGKAKSVEKEDRDQAPVSRAGAGSKAEGRTMFGLREEDAPLPDGLSSC